MRSLIILEIQQEGRYHVVSVNPPNDMQPEELNWFRKLCRDCGMSWHSRLRQYQGTFAAYMQVRTHLLRATYELSEPELLRDLVAEVRDAERLAANAAQQRIRKLDTFWSTEGKALAEYQKADVLRMVLNPRGLNCQAMGLGKTVETLLSLDPSGSALVMLPSVAKSVWKNEISMLQHAGVTKATVSLIEKRGKFRWPEPAEIVLMSYAVLPKAYPPYPADHKGIVYIIADECQALKTEESQRTKSIVAMLETITTPMLRVWGLTGTPIMNREMELWNILRTLGIEREVSGDMPGLTPWQGFFELFGGREVMKFVPSTIIRNGPRAGQRIPARHVPTYDFSESRRSPEVPERLARVIIRDDKSKVLSQLPEKRYQKISVDFSDLLSYLPDNAEMSSKEIKKALDDTDRKVTRSSDEEFMTLLSQEPTVSDYSRACRLLAEAKAFFLEELLDELEDAEEPCVVFSAHVKPIEIICQRDGWKSIQGNTSAKNRAQNIQDFQDGKLRGIALTIAAGGTAITLTRARELIFVDQDWQPGNNLQAEDRIHRTGQKRGCRIRYVVTDHPVEIRKYAVLAKKQRLITTVIDQIPTVSGIHSGDYHQFVQKHGSNMTPEQCERAYLALQTLTL